MDGKVWITGVGAVTALGFDFTTIAESLLAGRSAAKLVHDRNPGEELLSPGCMIDYIPTPTGLDHESFRQLPIVDQASLACCQTALRDSGWANRSDGLRVGLVLGTGGEWLRHWEMASVPGNLECQNGDTLGLLHRTHARLGIEGPRMLVAAACASGNFALALARNWIRQNRVDICIAAGVEMGSPILRASFKSLRALSRRIDAPEQASRPFDRGRDGLVMGEGAVAFVLESDALAQRRGKRPYGEVAGFGASSDAYHMIIPRADPEPVTRAITKALADAQIDPSGIDYINAHATSTPVGDKAEAIALRRVLGRHTLKTPVSSTKSMTGHLLSAAASIEALASLAAIRYQALPPTINLDDPDPECELFHVANRARHANVNVVVSNSFGFGGNNSSLVLKRVA